MNNIDNAAQLTFITIQLEELLALSQRADMHELRFLRDRRVRAIALKTLLEYAKRFAVIDDDVYARGKELILNILYENWSRQLLPKSFGVIPKGNTKQQDYLNTQASGHFLEPRSYIGIDPAVYGDLDYPSLVVAETLAGYTQPLHTHADTMEITFFDGTSQCYYVDREGVRQKIDVIAGDFVVFTPQTLHTIGNSSDLPVINMSIKFPAALKDRGKNSILGLGEAKKISLQRDGLGISSLDLTAQLGAGYRIQIFEFTNNDSLSFTSEGKSVGYILDGEFLVCFGTSKKSVCSKGDSFLFNKENLPTITPINALGKIYTAEFKADVHNS